MKVILDSLFLCDYVVDQVLSLALDALHDVDEAIHLLLAWIFDSALSCCLMALRFSPLRAFVSLTAFRKGHKLLAVLAQQMAHVGNALRVISCNVLINMVSIFIQCLLILLMFILSLLSLEDDLGISHCIYSLVPKLFVELAFHVFES